MFGKGGDSPIKGQSPVSPMMLRWIPVEDALPEDRREQVLVLYRNGSGERCWSIGHYLPQLRKWEGIRYMAQVTHWARIVLSGNVNHANEA